MTTSDFRPISADASTYVVDTRPLCAGMPFVLTDAAHPRMVLKHGSHFLVLDEMGQVPTCNSLGYGYYRYDTRQLSQWELRLNGVPLSLLSSDLHKGYSGRFLYTNPQLDGIAQQKITIERQVVLDEYLWELFVLENFGHSQYDLDLEMAFHSDFADMFEVRGLNLPERGQRMLPTSGDDNASIFLAYKGLDGILNETVIHFLGMKPALITDGTAHFKFSLPVRGKVQLMLRVVTKMSGDTVANADPDIGFNAAKRSADEHYRQWRTGVAHIESNHALFNLSIERAINDFYILRQPSPKGYGLAAGLPWYSAIFGRDSAIAALQAMPFMPELARECIEVLAAYQGMEENPGKDERPGKIMHELRLGELARTGRIPHSPYYGTVDATQLWLLLFCEYIKWNGDLDFARQHWPAVKAAVAYLDKEAAEGCGYLYYKSCPNGLKNQGWKDSDDSIVHFDGTLAEEPIAVAEAQAYLYAARRDLSNIADNIGQAPMARKLRTDAEALKEMFQNDFWMSTERYVCLALDGNGHQVGVISSNAGHCLWSEILDSDKANHVADRLMQNEMHSGWGIRTLSDRTGAFNPVSYHNGSVWPHDNAIIGEGMRKLGRVEDMMKIMRGIAEVAMNDNEHRLPELFCGFEREGGHNPVDYPVSCSPQAWAAGSLLHMIKSCLNFHPDATGNLVKVVEPALPEWLGNLTVRGLKVGKAVLDMSFENQHGSTFTKILRKSGNLKVIVEN